MDEQPPALISIDPDDYHAEHVGYTADGRQFFLTKPFVPAVNLDPGCEFIALYYFDARGRFLEAVIDNLGPRAQVDEEGARRLFRQRLEGIGPVISRRIEVQPFLIQRFGTVFGLISRPPYDDEEHLTVTIEPGNYMAFYAPWDSGEYDT